MSSLKLEFLTEAMEYLRPVLREIKTVEETAEAIIPDSCPDVTEILYTDGLSYLRGKELSEGAMSVSAGVSASVLCKPDGPDGAGGGGGVYPPEPPGGKELHQARGSLAASRCSCGGWTAIWSTHGRSWCGLRWR